MEGYVPVSENLTKCFNCLEKINELVLMQGFEQNEELVDRQNQLIGELRTIWYDSSTYEDEDEEEEKKVKDASEDYNDLESIEDDIAD